MKKCIFKIQEIQFSRKISKNGFSSKIEKCVAAMIDRPRPAASRQEQYMSSREWLKRHGLEARGVTAFQTLASCSFRHVDGVVDLKGKPAPCATSSDAVSRYSSCNPLKCLALGSTLKLCCLSRCLFRYSADFIDMDFEEKHCSSIEIRNTACRFM